MGCWNATCMTSGLPIVYGDDVVMFVICEAGGTWGAECYCHAEANLLSQPIFGKYDDYGGIEEIQENEETNSLFEFLKEKLVPSYGNELGVDTDNQYHHFKQSNTLSEILNGCIERGYAAINKFHYYMKTNVKMGVTNTFILREIWDKIIDEYGNTTRNSYDIYTQKMVPRTTREIFEAEFVKIDEIHEKFEKITKDGGMTPDDIKFFQQEQERSNNPLYRWDGWKGMDVSLLSKETIIDMMIFVSFLERARINLRPTTGKGSQSANYNLNEKLADWTKSIATRKIKEYNE